MDPTCSLLALQVAQQLPSLMGRDGYSRGQGGWDCGASRRLLEGEWLLLREGLLLLLREGLLLLLRERLLLRLWERMLWAKLLP